MQQFCIASDRCLVSRTGCQSRSSLFQHGALRTLDLLVPLEGSIGVPVVSSTPHGLWHCARMLGVDARIEGFGQVMAA